MLLNEIKYVSFESGIELVEIASDFEMLLHVEYPVLYVGKNAYGSRIIGSFVEEDEDDLTALYYIHFIIKDIDYSDFLAERTSYRDIFALAKTAFILKKDLASNQTEKVYLIKADNIPKDYLPHNNSLYPKKRAIAIKRKESSLSYKISLKGGIADSHHALSNDLLGIQSACTALLFDTINELPNLNLNVNIYQLAHTEGSFQLNFEVDIKQRTNDLFFRDEAFADYQNSIIEYIVNSLHNEAVELYSTQTSPPIFQELIEKAKLLYSELGVNVESLNLHESIKDSIYNTASNIVKASDSIGTNYDSLNFICVTGNDNTEVIAEVTSQSKNE